MKKILLGTACAVLVSTAALAQTATTGAPQLLAAAPANSTTVTNYYKQDVYDSSDSKIGSIGDVLVDKEGHVTAVIIGVGGFLGVGEKDVAAPFSALHGTEKNGKWYLVMSTTKDALKNARGYKYDKTNTTWVPDTK